MGSKPTKISLSLATILGLSIWGAPVYAAPLNEPVANVDDTMTVIGRSDKSVLNIATNVAVLDASDIEASGATNLVQLLRGRSGIQVSDSNSGAVFAMRGFSGEQAGQNTLVLIDGRRLNNIDLAAPNLDAIALNQIERIEILSGSAGVLYGDQAVGGVINIITKSSEHAQAGLQVSAGSFDTTEYKGDISGAITEQWRYVAAANYKETDNFRYHNDSETGSVFGRLDYQSEQAHFYSEAGYFDNHRLLAGGLSQAEFSVNPRAAALTSSKDYQHEITTSVRSGYQQQATKNWLLGTDVSYTDSSTNTTNSGFAGDNQRSQLSITPKAVATFATAKGSLEIVSGIDYHLGESEFSWGRSNTQTQTAAYVQATVPLATNLSYVVGGRYAKAEDELVDGSAYPNGVELDQDAKAFELGLNYRPSASQRFYLRAEDNFRFAKVDEQAYTSAGVIGLKPQTGRSYEAGWDLMLASHVVKLSLYRLSLEDEIVFDPSAPKPNGGFFDGANVNADASRRYGASANWNWQLMPDLGFGLEYHYVDAEFTQGPNKGKALSWVAAHSGRSYLSYDISDAWQLYTEASYTGERYLGGDNANLEPELDSYVLGNLALNYRQDEWSASLRLDNLFDEEYASAGFYSAWGNSFYSGDGRSIRLTAGYSF
ncbi:TonB-dependent receptor [Shewanella sp.]|uniref:TonB-dependent receptor n=1 Tax=Shewanella sp. TaxID=50422 RepID=UPI004054571D